MPSGAVDGVYQSVGVETFPATEHDRTIEWQPRPYHNRGKIIIGGTPVDDDRLNNAGSQTVPSGKEVRVFELTVKLDS